MPHVYLRPVGLLYGAVAESAVAAGEALPLAGGTIGFTHAELIEGTPQASERRLVPADALKEIGDPDVRDAVERATASRGPYAGLSRERMRQGRPVLMGIVNITPDSFSDGGLYDSTEGAVSHAAELAAAGAEIVDIGGESTRPGSDTVPGEDELSRVLPVLQGLEGVDAILSIDTRKADVARAAAAHGAKIFNDVSALSFDPRSIETARSLGLSIVLMHAQGEPKTMQDNPTYDDVVLEVYDYLAARITAITEAGIPPVHITVDPGIGFGKNYDHNFALLSHLTLFHALGVPVLVGASRKRFIQGPAGGSEPRAREPGSYAAALAAAAQGVQMLRVHDVVGTRQALSVWHGARFGTA